MNPEALVPTADSVPRLEKGSLSGRPLDKIVVAIHGIGSQQRSSTVRSVATRFGARQKPPIPVMPLGYFYIEKLGMVRVSALDLPPKLPNAPPDPLQRIGFAEVFWADIPGKVEKEQDTLEETKVWGATVVSRAQAAYHRNVPTGNLTAEDFQLVAGALDEVLETVEVLENLFTVAALAGVFKFDLAKLLRDYLGDVQVVTEFRFFREKIVYRFHDAMEQVVKWFNAEYPGRTPELYVVSHSEGTVISFLGLLEALSGRRVTDPEMPTPPPGSTDWIKSVRGFMTIGSPIDKHLVLWPKLWEALQLRSQAQPDGTVVFTDDTGKQRLTLQQPIRWRNYYDFGDPIGFQLDTAELWLEEQHCAAFEFVTAKHDFGFSRYLLPGKAHNDYWNDAHVFGHFIDDVVLRKDSAAPAPPAPPSSQVKAIVSTAIPYAISALLHAGAVFLLYKAVTAYVAMDPKPTPGEAGVEIALLTLLLAAVTVTARLPRLVKRGAWKWSFAGMAAFLVGAVPYWSLMPKVAKLRLIPISDDFAARLNEALHLSMNAELVATIAMLALAGIAALSGWLVPRKPRWARRVLVASGTLAVALIVALRVWDANADEPVWPVLLGGAAFVYLWWLGILIFDLAFLWHRYIRSSVAISNLWYWKHQMDGGSDTKIRPQKGESAKTVNPAVKS